MPVRKNSSSTLFSFVASTRRRTGKPMLRAMWPDRMLPKLPDGTANDTCWPGLSVARSQPWK
ncbi:hypothetical protein D3C78_1433670 [compost metagenome]